MKKDYVVINNRAYDQLTGLPVDDYHPEVKAHEAKNDQSEPAVQRGHSVHAVHRSRLQRSSTLNRRHVARPKAYSSRPVSTDKIKKAETIQKHQQVAKFSAPQKVVEQEKSVDRPAEKHPVVHRAGARQMDISSPQHKRAKVYQAKGLDHRPQVKKQLKPASQIKNQAIEEALEKEVKAPKVRRQKKPKSSFGRWLSMASAGLAIMMLGSYLAYLSMPNISIRMAAVQSGIDAKYPGYQPTGYNIRGPIAFKQGEVSIKFAYADGDKHFTLTQKKSNWDPSALRENLELSGAIPTTTMVDGLTIYTSDDNNAAWVNGGILYTLDGNAPLSGEQIRRIATSM